MSYHIPSWVMQACAALVRGCEVEPYITYIKQAEEVIGHNYALSEQAQRNRQILIEMVKLNLVNRDDYSRERLNAAFGLKISKNTLTAEKKKFVRAIAEKCGYY